MSIFDSFLNTILLYRLLDLAVAGQTERKC